MSDPPMAVPQPIRILHGLWVCGSCMGGMNNGVILHRADCGWLAEIAVAERESLRRLFASPKLTWSLGRVDDSHEARNDFADLTALLAGDPP
jgi:hypothetical protein